MDKRRRQCILRLSAMIERLGRPWHYADVEYYTGLCDGILQTLLDLRIFPAQDAFLWQDRIDSARLRGGGGLRDRSPRSR